MEGVVVSEQVLGRGKFGVVYKGFYGGQAVAVKEIQDKATAKHELAMMARLGRHPNVVFLHQAFRQNMNAAQLPGAPAARLVLDLCNCSLADLMPSHSHDPLELAFVERLTQQAENVLRYLRSKCIVHRDIKPSNLLLSANRILKLADFGLATIVNEHTPRLCHKEVGTPLYMAPEAFVLPHVVTHAMDMWSLGVVLHRMATGHVPFSGTSKEKLVAQLLSNPTVKMPSTVPLKLADLIKRMLCPADARLTLQEFAEHPFIQPTMMRRCSLSDLMVGLNEPDNQAASPHNFSAYRAIDGIMPCPQRQQMHMDAYVVCADYAETAQAFNVLVALARPVNSECEPLAEQLADQLNGLYSALESAQHCILLQECVQRQAMSMFVLHLAQDSIYELSCKYEHAAEFRMRAQTLEQLRKLQRLLHWLCSCATEWEYAGRPLPPQHPAIVFADSCKLSLGWAQARFSATECLKLLCGVRELSALLSTCVKG